MECWGSDNTDLNSVRSGGVDILKYPTCAAKGTGYLDARADGIWATSLRSTLESRCGHVSPQISYVTVRVIRSLQKVEQVGLGRVYVR